MKTFIISVFSLICAAAFALWNGETLSRSEVARRWGQNEFKIADFKKGTPEERAKMTANLLTRQAQFRGKDTLEVRELLGPFSGHYFSESYPTYLIQKGTETKPESWQVVFLIDRQSKVKDIIVHKNCCY